MESQLRCAFTALGRGQPCQLRDLPKARSTRKVKESSFPGYSTGLRKGAITCLKAREDCYAALTTHGAVTITWTTGLKQSKILTKPNENAFKLVLVHNQLFMVLKRNSEDFLRFYKVDLPLAQGRTRVLASTRYRLAHLVHVDMLYARVAVKTSTEFSVWSLLEEAQVFISASPEGVWYSKAFVVKVTARGTHTVFQITNLSTQHVQEVPLEGLPSFYHVECLGSRLLLGVQGAPLIVVDLEQRKASTVTQAPAKLYVQPELMEDGLVVDVNGTCAFVSGAQVEGVSSVACFSDTPQELYIYDFKATIRTEIERLQEQLPDLKISRV